MIPAWLPSMFVFLAGVSGAVITGFFTLRIDKRRMEEQRRAVNEQITRAIVVEFLQVTDHMIGMIVTGDGGADDVKRMFATLFNLKLAAPDAIGKKAERYFDAIHGFEGQNPGINMRDPVNAKRLGAETGGLKADFIAEVRKEYRLNTPTPPGLKKSAP